MNIQDYNHDVDLFSDGLYRFALKSINDTDQARDFVQDAFEKLWLKNYKVAHLGACDNKLFAVAGVNQIKALSQDNCEILWQKDLSVIFNSTPICDGESFYIS
jgi:DNA-directed RNA polymerase specialized sigma24 family protein